MNINRSIESEIIFANKKLVEKLPSVSKDCPGSQNYLKHRIRVSDKSRSEPNTGHLIVTI